MLQRYRTRLSGPLLDRIDLHIEVPRINHQELTTTAPAEASAEIRARVEAARNAQQARLEPLGVHCNSFDNRKVTTCDYLILTTVTAEVAPAPHEGQSLNMA